MIFSEVLRLYRHVFSPWGTWLAPPLVCYVTRGPHRRPAVPAPAVWGGRLALGSWKL